MPLYEYDCPGCGQPFEKRQPMSQADQTTCPHCGNVHPRRRLSRIAIKGQSTSSSSSTEGSRPLMGGFT